MKLPRFVVSCLLLAAALVGATLVGAAPVGAAGPLSGQSVGPLILPSSLLEEVRVPPPLRLAEEARARPLAELPAAVFAARSELQAVQEWNAAGRLPARAGFMRALPEAQVVELTEAPAAGEILPHAGGLLAARGGTAVWGAGVRVEEAWRLRLHLSAVELPEGARLWVYGAAGEVVGPFGAELRDPKGGLWTPSVGGPEIRLEVEIPDGSRARFIVDRAAEILTPGIRLITAADFSCFVDGRCIDPGRFPGVELARKAIAHLEFPADEPGFIGICSGGLINDTDFRTVVPYLLTANHCISTAADAAGAEAFWDYARTDCNGQAPLLSRVPRSNGATLVATAASSDFTLLRLGQIPSGRVLLGWNTAPVTNGTHLFRLSHPGSGTASIAFPQIFAETVVDSTLLQSPDWPRPRFIYARQLDGGMWGGSSGSPVLLANGQIVGQLIGAVGRQQPESCDFRSSIVDGAFSASFTSLRPFLAPSPAGTCRASADTLCLMGNRFRVRVFWQNQFDGTSGSGKPIPRSSVTGFFSFGDPSNVELLVKILDFGTSIKVFWGQLTNLRYNLEVTDTLTGRIQNYTNTPGNCGGIDQNFAINANPASPEGPAVAPLRAAAACRPGPNTLCLLKNRFAVEVDWRNQGNGTSGRGGAAALSNLTGTFTFSDRSNVELMVKMLNFSDRVALFWGALSDLDYTLKVTDTTTGVVKTYNSTPGRLCGGLDNNAF